MTSTLLGFGLAATILVVRWFYGWPALLTLLEYQRGVLFRRGLPVREIGPGRYRVWTGLEKVFTVDTRPIQISFEDQAVTLGDGATAFYGFSGSAKVGDARKAIYSARNYRQVPAYALLCCTRSVLAGSTASEVRADREGAASQITARARERFARAGMELLSFDITQLSIRSGAAEAN
jgi:SPFH domain / Band 7 family